MRIDSGITCRGLLLGAAALVLLALLETNPIQDTDAFWHVLIGQRIWHTGRLVTSNHLSYLHEGEPIAPLCWLSEIGAAWLYDRGGWPLLRWTHHLLLVLALAASAASTPRARARPGSLVVAMLLAASVLMHNVQPRSQTPAVLAFALLLALARSDWKPPAKLSAAVPLALLWQNAHPSLILGVLAVGSLAVADAWTRIRAGQGAWPGHLTLLAALLALLQLATPMGASVFSAARGNVLVSREILRIGEWLPPWDPKVLGVLVPYWLALLGTILAITWQRGRIDPRDAALLLVMTPLTLLASRFILTWSIALIPLWASLIDRLWPAGMLDLWNDSRTARMPKALAATAFLAIALAILALGPIAGRPVLHHGIPLEGIAALRDVLPGSARIYAGHVWTGPLLLEGSPDWRVTRDGGLYWYPDEHEWRRWADETAGRIPLDRLEQAHAMDAILIDDQSEGLRKLVETSPRWRLLWSSPWVRFYVRRRAGEALDVGGNSSLADPDHRAAFPRPPRMGG